MERLHPHLFRHTYAHEALSRGMRSHGYVPKALIVARGGRTRREIAEDSYTGPEWRIWVRQTNVMSWRWHQDGGMNFEDVGRGLWHTYCGIPYLDKDAERTEEAPPEAERCAMCQTEYVRRGRRWDPSGP